MDHVSCQMNVSNADQTSDDQMPPDASRWNCLKFTKRLSTCCQNNVSLKMLKFRDEFAILSDNLNRRWVKSFLAGSIDFLTNGEASIDSFQAWYLFTSCRLCFPISSSADDVSWEIMSNKRPQGNGKFPDIRQLVSRLWVCTVSNTF